MPESEPNYVPHQEPTDPENGALEQLLAQGAGTCPPPELIFACVEGVLPEEIADPIQQHISRCMVCRILIEEEGSLAGSLSPRQNKRILSRVGAAKSASRLRYLSAAAAIIVVVGIAGFYRVMHKTRVSPIAAAPAVQQATPTPPWLIADLKTLAPLPPPAAQASDVIQRGATSVIAGEPGAAELLPAFRAYNRLDYVMATKEFSVVTLRYPHAYVPNLYLGISQLELNQNIDAARTLQPFANLPSPSPDILWYMAVAKARLDDPEAASLLRQTCNAGKLQSSPNSNLILSCNIASQLGK